MRIPLLFTIPNFITAGSGRAMLNIIERLDRDRFAPAVCVSRKGGELDKEVERMDIPLIEAPFTVPARPYTSLPIRVIKAARAFRPYKFKLWHSFHYSDDYTEPMIARAAGASAWMYTKKNMGWGSRAWRLRSFFASGIAAQNAEMLMKFFPNQTRKVRLIPCGINTTSFESNGRDNFLRKDWGFPEGTTVIGHVGHFVPVKNHQHLLKAFALTRRNTGLVLAGDFLDAQYIDEIRKLAAELKIEHRIRLLGNVKDIGSLLKSVDIFAFCSHKEACPVAVLEAMASRLPCVVNDIPAMTEIHRGGETALVVPKDDLLAFAAALDALALDVERRHELGEAAQRRIQNQYTIEREASAYTQFYFDVLGC
jgi:glycosyltransferase involved in cell wall biosynthesis